MPVAGFAGPALSSAGEGGAIDGGTDGAAAGVGACNGDCKGAAGCNGAGCAAGCGVDGSCGPGAASGCWFATGDVDRIGAPVESNDPALTGGPPTPYGLR